MATPLLEQAFAVASQLPEDQQDAYARNWLAEMESERKWDEAFADSQDVLKVLDEEARARLGGGKSQPLDPDTL